MARMTISSFFYAFTFLQCLASTEAAAWLPRTNVLPRQAATPPPAAIPPQCESVCTPALAALQACTPATVSCLCPPSLQGGLFNCFSCAGMAGNATDYSSPQMEIDDLTVACDQAGMPLPKKTFPGQNPNRALSTSATGPAMTSTPPRSSSQTAANTTGQSMTQISQTTGSTQTAPTVPLSTSAAPTSGTTATTAPTTTSTSNATKYILPMWMVISGVLLGAILHI